VPPDAGASRRPQRRALSFEEAAERVKTTKARPTNEQLLELYGCYKQATEGDNTKPRPGFAKVKDRAKWDAWKTKEGVSVEDAKKRYVETVLAIDPSLEIEDDVAV
jgi:diazepam-binding inhibitor (GABA receptor modulating acyl-CoA-binding protein)